MDNASVILHIPHSSVLIPDDIRHQLLISYSSLQAELLRMTDWYVDELFSSSLTAVRFPFSRLVCDVERFREDELETMSTAGMGAIYTKTSSGETLRMLTPKKREDLLSHYYDPHHQTLNKAVGKKIDANGQCLIIDCHSFPSLPLPHEPSQKSPRPDICIGTDSYHTSSRLVDAFYQYFTKKGYIVSLNDPFSGSMVPGLFYKKDPRVASIMVEINRKLYMDPDFCSKT